MKFLKLLTVSLCAAAMFTSVVIADDAAPAKKKACCEATVDAEKKCDHKCCQKAAADGKICKKCHPDAKKDADKKPA